MRKRIKLERPVLTTSRVVAWYIKRLNALIQTVCMNKNKFKRLLALNSICLCYENDCSIVNEVNDANLKFLETKRK